jgi:hypothetical protein
MAGWQCESYLANCSSLATFFASSVLPYRVTSRLCRFATLHVRTPQHVLNAKLE